MKTFLTITNDEKHVSPVKAHVLIQVNVRRTLVDGNLIFSLLTIDSKDIFSFLQSSEEKHKHVKLIPIYLVLWTRDVTISSVIHHTGYQVKWIRNLSRHFRLYSFKTSLFRIPSATLYTNITFPTKANSHWLSQQKTKTKPKHLIGMNWW